MNFSERPIIITDFETTGLDPLVHDIIEIGAIKVDQEYLEEVGRISRKVQIQNPDTVQLEALAINGYTESAWGGSWGLLAAMLEFADFAKDGVLAAWNITFEYGFLAEAFRRAKITNPMDYHRIDVPSIVWFKYPRLIKMGQNDIGKLLGLPPEADPHRAINGAEYAWSILRQLRYQ